MRKARSIPRSVSSFPIASLQPRKGRRQLPALSRRVRVRRPGRLRRADDQRAPLHALVRQRRREHDRGDRRSHHAAGEDPAPREYEELVKKRFIIAGTPEEVIDRFALVQRELGSAICCWKRRNPEWITRRPCARSSSWAPTSFPRWPRSNRRYQPALALPMSVASGVTRPMVRSSIRSCRARTRRRCAPVTAGEPGRL
jgi:hypothetical protein